MAATPERIVILGNNDTACQLQQRLQRSLNGRPVSLLHDSEYPYLPSACLPQLLAGNLSLADALLQADVYRNPRVNQLRDSSGLGNATVINTLPDPQHISVLRLPGGRQRCIPLYRTDDVIAARRRLADADGMLVFGASLKAVLYATAAARAGYHTCLVADQRGLIHRGFDHTATSLIHQRLQESGIHLLQPHQLTEQHRQLPGLYTPFSGHSNAVSKARQQLKNHFRDFPQAQHQLQDGADWYELPEQVCEQLVQRLGQDSPATQPLLARLWHNKPGLPHRFSINDLAVHYAGQLQPGQTEECITLSVPECGIYRKIILAGNRIAGFLLAGDVSGSELLADMMLTHRNINDCRDELIFTGH